MEIGRAHLGSTDTSRDRTGAVGQTVPGAKITEMGLKKTEFYQLVLARSSEMPKLAVSIYTVANPQRGLV
jgi:hypothetical protein